MINEHFNVVFCFGGIPLSLGFGRSLHFPIICITHINLPLEQNNNLLVFKHRTPHWRGNCFLLTDHVDFKCSGWFWMFP